MRPLALLTAILLLPPSTATDRPPAALWGAHGHRIAAEAAVAGLPAAMPAFFRARGDQLVFLSSEPDRWRDGGMTAMDRAWAQDHHVNLERVPPGALEAGDRWTFLDRLYRAGVEDAAGTVGFLPYRILELHQRLVNGWRRWKATSDPGERRWIEERIAQDAGILGHYVTDASQPHHTTIHFNGWAPGAPNPAGYPRDRSFHSRFESAFVGAHVDVEDLRRILRARRPRRLDDVPAAVLEHVRASHRWVEELYRLDRDLRFDPERAHPETVSFAVERLAAGAAMLQDLWWSAWLESAG